MCNNIRINTYIKNFIFARLFVAIKNFVPLINGRTHNEVVANGMLRKVCGAKGEKVRGDGRKYQREKHYNLSSSPNRDRMIKSRGKDGGTCGTGKERNTRYRGLVKKKTLSKENTWNT